MQEVALKWPSITKREKLIQFVTTPPTYCSERLLSGVTRHSSWRTARPSRKLLH
jgi:hypothetical protein